MHWVPMGLLMTALLQVGGQSELHNVNFFTQIISVQLNLPQKKARKLREIFGIESIK